MTNPESIEENIDRFDYIKIKNFCMVKQNNIKTKIKDKLGENIFNSYYRRYILNTSRAPIGQ